MWNFSSRVQLDISLICCAHLWAIKLNIRREIPHLLAPMYYSLYLASDEKIQSISQMMGSFRSAEKRRLENCLAFAFELSSTWKFKSPKRRQDVTANSSKNAENSEKKTFLLWSHFSWTVEVDIMSQGENSCYQRR